jgi:hypothetical protein
MRYVRACLSPDEMREIRLTKRAHSMAIAAVADKETRILNVLFADGTFVSAPFDEFEPSDDGTTPDFDRLKIIDHGYTIHFGEYEASADSLEAWTPC